MANETKIASLVNPEVMADLVEKKYTDYVKFAEICDIDNTLVGRAGDTITLPQYAYIGNAVDVGELEQIPVVELTATSTPVQVKKIGKSVILSDEAVLSGYGDPMGETEKQFEIAIAGKQDADILAALDGATWTTTPAKIDADAINEALVKMGEDFEGTKFLYVSPAVYSELRKAKAEWIPASQLAGEVAATGIVGMIYGCLVRVTNKLTDKAFIVKPGAVRIFNKRGVLVEADRVIGNQSTQLAVTKHYAAYLYNNTKVVKITATPGA